MTPAKKQNRKLKTLQNYFKLLYGEMSEILGFKGKVDFTQAKKDYADFEKFLASKKISMPSAAGSDNFANVNKKLNGAMRDSLLQTEKLRQENIRLRNEYEQGRITAQQLAAQIRANNEQRKQEASALRAAKQAQQAANGSYNEATARLKQLGVQIRSVAGGFKATGPIQEARIREYTKLNAQLTEFDRKMGIHGRNVGNYSSVLKGAAGQLAGFVATYVSASASISAVVATFNQSLKSDAVRTSLEFTFGSVDLADAKLEQLLDTANRLGVNYNALTSSYKSFTGAVIASNFDFQEGERIFNAVTGASSRLKLSAEDTEGALRALQQMISKGNVQAEELRGQLGERIPGAFSIAARAMGKTEAELNKMLQKGEVLAADLLPKLSIELEKTFSLSNTEQIEGMTAEVERFKNIFSGLVAESSNTSKFFSTVIKGFNEIFGTIADMVNSDSWNEFWTRLIVGREAGDVIKGIASSMDQANAAIQKNLTLNENSSVKDRAMSYEQLSIAHQKATQTLDLLNKKIADGGIEDVGGLDGNRLKNEIALLNAKMKAEKAILDKMKADAAPKGKSAEQLAAEKKAAAEAEAMLKAQRALQKKITDIKNEAFRKTLTKDEEEIQAVKDKFAKITEEVRVFNANPKNKLKVDGSGLDAAMKNQIISIEYKQDTEKLKENLEIQKGIYEEYESYRISLGKKAADERFSAEIDITRKYADVLQAEYDKILNQGSKTGFTGAMTERMKVLEAAIRKEGELEQKHQDDLMKSLLSFDQERELLEENYNRDRINALTKGGGQGLEVLEKNYKTQLAALGDAHLQELDAFKLLYIGIDRLSDENAKKVISNAEDALNGLKTRGVVISKELEAELKQLFGDSKRAIDDRLPEKLINLANQIDLVVSSVGGIDTAFGKVLSTVSNVVGQVGNIKKGMSDFDKAGEKGDVLGQFGAGLGILGAGISIFKSVFSLFDRSQQREEQAAYARDLQNKQTEAVNKALERQIALLDDAYGTERLVKYSQAIKQAQENETKYREELNGRLQLTGDKTLDKYITELNTTGKIADTAFFGTKFIDELRKKVSGLPQDIESLQRLLDEGKLDASTAVIVQNLIQANKTAQELANNLNAENVGSSLSQIADDFIKTLTDGTQDFGKSFEETIRTSILNGFKGKLIEQQLQAFYTQFAELSAGGLTQDEITALRDAYSKAAEKAKQDILDLEKATGIKLGGDGSTETKKTGISAAIVGEALKEDTANRMLGLGQGQYDLTKQIGMTMGEMLNVGRSKLAALEAIAANTLRSADNTDRLANIESALTSIDKKTAAKAGGDPLGQALRDAGIPS